MKVTENESWPLVVIAGRSNVGKSTLFNRLSRKRLSIVDARPGVTRDILENRIEIDGLSVRLVDTGGIEFADSRKNPLQQAAEQKAFEIIQQADLVLFLLDGRVEVTGLELDLLRKLRKKSKKVILVINKREGVTHEPIPADVYALGWTDLIQVSATHGDGISFLKERIAGQLEKTSEGGRDLTAQGVRLAILGKPNVGKSTLFNALLGEQRSLVSDQPGTTRDAVENRIYHDSGVYTLVDTAGLARKTLQQGDIAFYAAIRSWQNLKDAQVCLLVMDLETGLTRQDKRIAHEIVLNHRGCLVFLNKLDRRQILDRSVVPDHLIRDMRQDIPFLEYAVFHCGSALDPALPGQLLDCLLDIAAGFHRKIPTSVLSHSIKDSINDTGWLLSSGKPFRVYYAFQEFTAPPRLRFLTNFRGSNEQKAALARKISRKIRTEMNWEGVPVIVDIQNRS